VETWHTLLLGIVTPSATPFTRVHDPIHYISVPNDVSTSRNSAQLRGYLDRMSGRSKQVNLLVVELASTEQLIHLQISNGCRR
jgi:hypothetical protein